MMKESRDDGGVKYFYIIKYESREGNKDMLIAKCTRGVYQTRCKVPNARSFCVTKIIDRGVTFCPRSESIH